MSTTSTRKQPQTQKSLPLLVDYWEKQNTNVPTIPVHILLHVNASNIYILLGLFQIMSMHNRSCTAFHAHDTRCSN